MIALAALYIVLSQKNLSPLSADPTSPWLINDAWRLNLPREQTIILSLPDKTKMSLRVLYQKEGFEILFPTQKISIQGKLETQGNLTCILDGTRHKTAQVVKHDHTLYIFADHEELQLELQDAAILEDEKGTSNALQSPMPGTVIAVLAKVGDSVKRGENLLVLEAMKM